jgi:hypothetical protein
MAAVTKFNPDAFNTEAKKSEPVPSKPSPDKAKIGTLVIDSSMAPRPIDTPLLDVVPLTPDMLPEPLRGFISDVAHRMNCPLDYPAVAMISMLGSAIGSRCAVKPKQKDSWHEVPNLWGGIVAPPSSKKTPATSEILSLLKPLEHEASERFNLDLKEYGIKAQILDGRKKRLIKEAINADDSKAYQQQILEIENELEQSHPKMQRYQVNDVTPEKLADICTQNPQGVMVFRDELIGLLKSWEKQGNEAARAFFLEGWNGKQGYKIDRILRGSQFVNTLCLTVFGGIQPDKLQEYVGQMMRGENDGLMQRFQLLVYPDLVAYKYVDEYPDGNAKLKAAEIVRAIVSADEARIMQWGGYQSEYDKIPKVSFSGGAQYVFEQWYNHNYAKSTSDEISPAEQQHLAKYPKLMPCLALIFHFIDCASGNESKQISETNIALSVRWCEYLESHAGRIYNMASMASYSAIILSKRISDGRVPDEFTVPDIQRKGWHSLKDNKVIKEAVDILLRENWIIDVSPDDRNAGRPPSPVYSVNPLARGYYIKK